MIGSRLYLGEEATKKLRSLAQRTQMTPNLLCRIGLCVSLEDATPLDVQRYTDGNAREFNLSTLLGNQQDLFLALMRQRRSFDDPSLDVRNDPDDAAHLRGHISRGVIQLSLQVKAIEDFRAFLPRQGVLPREDTADSTEVREQ